MNNIFETLFLNDKLGKVYHQECIDFINWVNKQLDDTSLEKGLSTDFTIEARKRIDKLIAISEYLSEVHEKETE